MSDITKLLYIGSGAVDELTVTNGTTDSSTLTFPSTLSLEGIALVPQDGIYFVSAITNSGSSTSIYEEHAGLPLSFTSALATENNGTGVGSAGFGVDTINNALYFIDNSSLYTERFGSGFSGTPTTVDLGTLGSISNSSVGPTGALVYDSVHNAVYYAGDSGGAGFTTSSGGTIGGGVKGNYIYKVTGLSGSSFTSNTQAAVVPLNDGMPVSMALDTATDTLYFTTERSVGDGSATLGLYGLSLSGSSTPFAVYTETSSTGAFGVAWNELGSLTVDSQTGEYYITALLSGGNREIFAGNVNTPGAAPTLFLAASSTAPADLAIDGGPVLSGTSVHAIDGNTAKTTGAITTADTVTLAVTLNGNVTVSGTPSLSLNDGGTATYASGSGSNVLLFTYTPTSGQSAGTLAVTGMTGTVTDAFGAGFDDTITASFSGLSVDNSPPTLTLSSTSNDALQGGASTLVLSGNPTITDTSGSGTLTGATIALANAQTGDVLGIDGSTSGSLDGINYTFSGSALTLSGTTSLGNYEAVLGQVTYQDGGTDSTTSGHPVRTLDWHVTEGGLVSATQTSSITIERALTVSASGTVTAILGGSAVLDSSIAITDLDAAAVTSATVSISSGLTGGDVLNFTAQNGISGSYNASTGVLTLSGSASAANYQAALASISFSNTSAGGGTRGISYVVSDAVGASNTGSSTVQVDVGPSFVSGSVLAIDGNGSDTTGVAGVGDTVTIAVTLSKAGTVSGTPVLSLNDGGTASYVSGSGSDVLLFTYAPSSGQDTATLGVTGLSGTVTDNFGAAISNGVTASFSGLSVDTTPPSLTISSPSVDALQGGGSIGALAGIPTIADPDGTGTLTGATIAIANAQSGDVLGVNGATSGLFDGISFTFSGSALTLSGSASLANYETVLGDVTYQDGGADTTTSGHPVRTLDWSVNEGTLASATQASTITIKRALTLSAGGTVTLTSGGSVAVDSGIAITDLDNDPVTSAVVAIVSGFEAGDELNFVNQNGITGSYDAATGTLSLSGSASAADYQAALASVSISSLNADPSDGGADTLRSIGYEVADATGVGNFGFSDVVAVCYLRGTRILTAVGEQPVEALAIGDMVATRRGGLRRIKWIGRQSFDPRFVRNNREKLPVCIKAGALGGGLPLRDLFVSPGHSMLLGETLVLARNLVNGVTISQSETAEDVHYYQLELEAHDCVLAEGSWSESYADGPGLRAQFHNAAEFAALYPDYVEPAEVSLCLPRPQQGAALAAALAPVVAQAAQGQVPGAMLGWVDRIEEGRIEGWAVDLAQPELPVLLEVLHGEDVLGTILACDPRLDLRVAGYAQGHCSFSFAAPLGLASEAITVRRAADGCALPFAHILLAHALQKGSKAA